MNINITYSTKSVYLRDRTISMTWIPQDSSEAFPIISLNFKKRSPVMSNTHCLKHDKCIEIYKQLKRIINEPQIIKK